LKNSEHQGVVYGAKGTEEVIYAFYNDYDSIYFSLPFLLYPLFSLKNNKNGMF
jgi:hypothetical protein